jgi:chorismate mutase
VVKKEKKLHEHLHKAWHRKIIDRLLEALLQVACQELKIIVAVAYAKKERKIIVKPRKKKIIKRRKLSDEDQLEASLVTPARYMPCVCVCACSIGGEFGHN